MPGAAAADAVAGAVRGAVPQQCRLPRGERMLQQRLRARVLCSATAVDTLLK